MGDQIGMLEVVLNAKTIANINKDAGGTGAVLEDKTIVKWLRKHNPTDAEYNAAVETFILSCAGYLPSNCGIAFIFCDSIEIRSCYVCPRYWGQARRQYYAYSIWPPFPYP